MKARERERETDRDAHTHTHVDIVIKGAAYALCSLQTSRFAPVGGPTLGVLIYRVLDLYIYVAHFLKLTFGLSVGAVVTRDYKTTECRASHVQPREVSVLNLVLPVITFN